jgi:riboflavin biosynthesis pyrimidine reductase
MKVVSNTAISLDGRINTRERRFAFFGSERDHARMSRLRAEADAVLVGGATFRNWPHPALPDAADRAELRGRPWNVVVSRSLDLPLEADFFTEPATRPLLLARAASLAGRKLPAGAEAEGWAGEGDLPIGWILGQLARRGVEHLLVEAGGDLLFQFIAADAIDEIYLTSVPAGRRRRRAEPRRRSRLRPRRAAPLPPGHGRAGRRRGVPALRGDQERSGR